MSDTELLEHMKLAKDGNLRSLNMLWECVKKKLITADEYEKFKDEYEQSCFRKKLDESHASHACLISEQRSRLYIFKLSSRQIIHKALYMGEGQWHIYYFCAEKEEFIFSRGIYTTRGYLATLDHIVTVWRSECGRYDVK